MVSIVIGTYNRVDQIKRAVESVVAQTRTPFHLYITDAGSTDGTVEYLESIRSERITPIMVGKRLGQARALNDLFEQITTPYGCWLSDDNLVVDGGLDKAITILKRDPRIGMVGLKVRDVVGPFVDAPYIGGMSVFGVLNVNQGVLRTDLLRQVGYFSEEFRDYGIDPDITVKVLLAGYDIVFTRDIAIHHYRNWETDPASPAYADLQARQQRYLQKYSKMYQARFPLNPTWVAKRVLWKLLSIGLQLNIHSPRRFLGMNVRDWHNCLTGRYISVLRELAARDGLYHLRQRARRGS